jgi:cytoskeletal protein RodZ
MTDTNAAAARARGQALRSARIARARTIRRRVISAGVALFVAAWLMIAVVLISGHDPALASKASSTSSATTVASTPTATTSSSGSTAATGSTGTQNNSSSSSGTSSSSGVSSVTTSQS